jgi:predicted aspartyl protease
MELCARMVRAPIAPWASPTSTVRVPGRRSRSVRFLVDSGAVYSVLRRADWRALGLVPARELDFVLADGTTLTRSVSQCTFELEGRKATSPLCSARAKTKRCSARARSRRSG